MPTELLTTASVNRPNKVVRAGQGTATLLLRYTTTDSWLCDEKALERLRAWCPSYREPFGLMAARRWSPGAGLPLWPSWSHRRQVKHRRPRRPCHLRAISSGHERYPADSHGQLKEAVGLAGSSLTWGGGAGRNCMARKRSGQNL